MLYLPFGWWHEVHSHPSDDAGGMCASVSHFYTPFFCRPGGTSKLGPLLMNARYMRLWEDVKNVQQDAAAEPINEHNWARRSKQIAQRAIKNDEALFEFKARLRAKRG